MDSNELIGLLESVLGPVVADLSSSLNELLEQPQVSSGETQNTDQSPHGTITSLLSTRPDVGLAILDARSLRVRSANATLLTLLGKPGRPQDAVGRSLDELAPQLAGTDIDDAFRHVAATGYTFAAIIAQDSALGSAYLRCALSPIRQQSGSYDSLLLTLIDISGEVAARELLLERSQTTRQHGAIADAESLRAAVRTTSTDLLAGTLNMEDALAGLGEVVGGVGDCAAIFALGEGDMLRLATLCHRDTAQGMRLRTAFTEDAPDPRTDVFAQVVTTGQPILIPHWGPQHTEQISEGLRADVEAAYIESLVCVPMRSAPHTVGILLAFSTQASHGGTARVFQPADVALLSELADQMAQAIQTVLLREDVRATQAEHAAVLEASSDGIAVYDAQGRLRLINPIGRELLSRPVEAGPDRGPVSGPALFKRTFLDHDGRPLSPDELPWLRALRGERVGEPTPVPLVVEWAGRLRRTLHVHAIPISGDDRGPRGAIATLRAAPEGPPAAPAAANGSATTGEVEWAHWRETMELLDEAVVLCEPDGTAVFVNAAGRALLSLPSNLVSDEDSRVHGNLWAYVFRPDGEPLSQAESPVALALAGKVVRAQPTSVGRADGTRLPVLWDARRIDRADGATLGVALIAWPMVPEQPIDTQATQPTTPAPFAPPVDAQRLPTTTLLPGRKLVDHLPPTQTLLNGRQSTSMECDLTDVCAREARGHRDTAARRLEIRLPRRRVLVAADPTLIQRAVTSLISAAATALPATAPLHLAVWIERSVEDGPTDRQSLVPPAIDVAQLKTVEMTPDRLAELAAPTRSVAPHAQAGAPSAVAVVRVCSPNLQVPAPESAAFDDCREAIEEAGGRAWARVDPVLGPTYSFSVPILDVQD